MVRAVTAFGLIFTVAVRVDAFCFDRAGLTYRVSPGLLRAIARVESDMDPSALNRNRDGSYDYGLMQINSCWQEGLNGNWHYLSDPCYNVMVGSWILRQCIERYGYTWDAVACYHTGKGISDLKGPRKQQAITYVGKVRKALRRKNQ
jgi:soluble lytic murein transglycosylase-like protein